VRVRQSVIAAVLAVGVLAAFPCAPADAAAKHYKNCAALQKAYPHGVGKSGARDHTSGKAVTTFKVSSSLYAANDKRNASTGEYDLDRDNDGIACEKL
jgi:hypothetical protein